VKFLAGRQAFEDYRKRFAVTNELSGLFTSHFETVPQNTQKLIIQNKELRQQIGKLQEELLPIQVEQLAAKAERINGKQFVTAVYDDFDPKLLGQLAGLVSAKTKGVTLLFSDERFVLTSDKGTGLHAGNLVKELAQALGIKGGGNETSAQAGGLSKSQQEAVIRKIRDALDAQ
jgi:alanyl-tRNA synthetase